MRLFFASVLIVSSISTGVAHATPVLLREAPAAAERWPAFGGLADTANPGVTSPLAPAPKPSPGPVTGQAERLDDLFGRLAHAGDADEADGLAHAIERLWLRSGSDTADLLMVRSVAAIGKGKLDVAAQLLDRIVAIDPTWTEAWNKRATLRFLKGDDSGAMQDIAEVLAREPRHFGALSGMGVILQRVGMDKQALDLIRRTEAIYPHNAELEKLEGELSLKVEGRDI
ncbi:hypothetical protein P7D22_10795 [Lichenihabitans sp. Uapishka_5]|uniref:hypothetical protein n=1 Tax=Lichenihabitans sp. Uapishka_5 TaxID=3037302 RepID=UPI0029E7F14C|nr:hypothetical protein [Lichenihabitans sp. Uapishka_5]MDX7951655.1 hypothetical protein [Lichenihabitans sp. Uapishka_5]